MLFIIIFCFLYFFAKCFGHPDNYIQADPLVTPAHIVPEWYLLPFYAILRAIPSKLGGVIFMFVSIFVLMFLPWLDTSESKISNFQTNLQKSFFGYCFQCYSIRLFGSKTA